MSCFEGLGVRIQQFFVWRRWNCSCSWRRTRAHCWLCDGPSIGAPGAAGSGGGKGETSVHNYSMHLIGHRSIRIILVQDRHTSEFQAIRFSVCPGLTSWVKPPYTWPRRRDMPPWCLPERPDYRGFLLFSPLFRFACRLSSGIPAHIHATMCYGIYLTLLLLLLLLLLPLLVHYLPYLLPTTLYDPSPTATASHLLRPACCTAPVAPPRSAVGPKCKQH